MANVSTSKTTPISQNTGSDYVKSISIIGALFFIFGFVTWLNGVLIPYLRIACELSIPQSYLVASAFFIAYFVMAIPSAWVLKATGFKKGMSVGLLVMAVGALIFIPAAQTRTFGLFLFAQFIIGTGLAVLQTAVNPYATIIGPLESAAKRISIMGICNKVAGAMAPLILGAVVLNDADALKERLRSLDVVQKAAELDALAARVITPYLIMAGILVLLAVLIIFSSLPEVDTDQEDETVAAANSNKTSPLQFPHLLLGVLTMFLYVGVEVIAGDTIIDYANGAYGIPFDNATKYQSLTLAAMIVGYIIGIITIPKYIKQDNALKISAVLGVILAVAAILTDGYVSVVCIALLGLANSLMWPAIWPLALADLGRFTKIGSSFLIMAIAGGAILPLVYASLASSINRQQAYWIMVPCYLFIWYFAAAGHKIRSKA